MNVFIAGATGVLGRRVVLSLVSAGHHVAGLSRSPANTEWLRLNGAEPRPGDLFNGEQLGELVSGSHAVLHLATAIPKKRRTTLADWALNDRIRREGTQNLVEAALRSGCQFYLQQSVVFLYGDRHGDWADEQTSIPLHIGGILQSAADMEGIVMTAARQRRLPASILRFGSFYSADSFQTRTMLELIRVGRFPVIGDGTAYWNPIHVDDAASAVVKAVERPSSAISQVFNVCDDFPVRNRDLMDFIARSLGAKRPPRLPVFAANLIIGAHTVRFLRASARCRNQRIKEGLGWRPKFPTYQIGIKDVLEKWPEAGVEKARPP